jgi:ribonuclease-3
VVNGADYGEGGGRTKKEAEQQAAAAAYAALEAAPAENA